MKAIVYSKYGGTDQLKYLNVEKPKIVRNQVLVKVHAACINQADVYLLNGKPLPIRFISGLFKPKSKILGANISGVIEQIGEGVSNFKVGDEVFGELEVTQNGGFAEYTLIKPNQITLTPSNTSHITAASLPMVGFTALQGLRLANVKEGSNILIYGASGGVGTTMIQIAKASKANVTAVCSTRNIEVAKASNADKIIDYTKEQWDKDNIKYDAVIGCNGYNHLTRYRDALKDNGTYVVSGGHMKQIMQVTTHKSFMRKKGNKQFKTYVAKIVKSDLNTLAELLKNKEIVPYIDKIFNLDETKDAFDYFLSNKAIGKIAIQVFPVNTRNRKKV